MLHDDSAPAAVPPVLRDAFPPRPDELLARVSALVTDEMLLEISEADYGMDADKHLAALRGIRDLVRLPSPLEWEPVEVLELERWSDPDNASPTARFVGE